MKIVISPAKSLNLESKFPKIETTQPYFIKEATQINKVLKKLKPKELSELMSISDKLADLNWQRNQEWSVPFTENDARPAVFTFDGDVYSGLDVYNLPESKLGDLSEKLRILSGLYGLLEPMDLIQAYRLEMGTKIVIGEKKNLYEFWKVKITEKLNSELNDGELLINLASNEYFQAIDKKKLKATIITPEFKDYKDGKLKMISFFAKKARGMMVRFIIENNCETLEDIKRFNYDGYKIDELLTKGNVLVFTR